MVGIEQGQNGRRMRVLKKVSHDLATPHNFFPIVASPAKGLVLLVYGVVVIGIRGVLAVWVGVYGIVDLV